MRRASHTFAMRLRVSKIDEKPGKARNRRAASRNGLPSFACSRTTASSPGMNCRSGPAKSIWWISTHQIGVFGKPRAIARNSGSFNSTSPRPSRSTRTAIGLFGAADDTATLTRAARSGPRRSIEHRSVERNPVAEQRGLEAARLLGPADALLVSQRRLVLPAPERIVGQDRDRRVGESRGIGVMEPGDAVDHPL